MSNNYKSPEEAQRLRNKNLTTFVRHGENRYEPVKTYAERELGIPRETDTSYHADAARNAGEQVVKIPRTPRK
ncbi:hypothetical protein STHU_09460 [Allostella humosa]|nr:hypothetical protein STHU_09460 [Stella humosa]